MGKTIAELLILQKSADEFGENWLVIIKRFAGIHIALLYVWGRSRNENF
jgi:hypothetical protein